MTPPAAAPILVADTRDSFQVLQACLSNAFELAHATTCEQALALVQPLTPLVLCGVNFDDGRVYELLRALKADAALARVPFVVTRVNPGELDDAMYEGVKVAAAAIGANGFVDLFRWKGRYGQQEAGRRLLERVRALVD